MVGLRRLALLAMLSALPFFAQDTGQAEHRDKQAKSQEDLKRQRPKPATGEEEEIPPEEDVSVAVTEYSFNPLQAERELRTGNFYFKKGSYRAAALRFQEAVKWNDGYSEAWLRLGETQAKLKDRKAAREAYNKYLTLADDAKQASEVRKRLKKLK
jgi:tetratricopeptide (TPR) repeat protein